MLKIDLTGRTAVVTGASGELGRVITRTLAECGANVAIHYLNSEAKAKALQAEIKNVKSCLVQADVTKEAEVMRMRDEVAAQLGDPDIIVNNAVIQYTWVPILEQGLEDYRSQFESCTMHNVLMAKAFVPGMIRKQWGRVIAINTECAMQCTPNQSAYASAKRGMDGVLRVLAREIGCNGITVNQVAPGWMMSDKYKGESNLEPRGYTDKIPLRHRGEDQDIANAVAFLASDLAKFISGMYLSVSGGDVMPTI